MIVVKNKKLRNNWKNKKMRWKVKIEIKAIRMRKIDQTMKKIEFKSFD